MKDYIMDIKAGYDDCHTIEKKVAIAFMESFGRVWYENCRKYFSEPHLKVKEGEAPPVIPQAEGCRIYGHYPQEGNNVTKNVPPIAGAYPFIPMRGDDLVRLLCVARRYAKRRYELVGGNRDKGTDYNTYFMDAGCGPGFTLELAKLVGFEVCEGVELNKVHVEYGRNKGLTIHEINMMDFDYTGFSVVYAYVPFQPFKTFTDKVMRAAPVGTVFVWCGGGYPPKEEEDKYDLVYNRAGNVFIKTGE